MWCTDKETENILQFICKIKLSDETRNLSDFYIFLTARNATGFQSF